jgi:osmotically-inducible protein OsmY
MKGMLRRLVSIALLLLAATLFAQQTPPPTADDALYDEIRNVLAVDRDVRGAAIEVIVKNGVVILRGRVRDNKAREKAPKLAEKVKGVTKVTSELKLFTDK